jgi:transcriptional regulator with XRE-family HTH domain
MPRPRAPIGENLARLRRRRSLTQEALAEQAGLSVDLIKKLEQRQRDSARVATLDALAAALDVTLADLTGDAPVAPVEADAVGPTWPTMDGMNADDLTGIRRTIAHLVALDTAHGSIGLERVGVRAFADARHRLAVTPCSGDLAVEILEAVAELGQLSAWLLHDADRNDAARTALTEALLLASTGRTGRDRIELMIVNQLAMLAVSRGAFAEALRLADRGVAMADGASPRIRAMAAMRRGRALAVGGHRAGLVELRRATALLGDGVRGCDPPWAWWVTIPEITVHQALAASAVGDHGQAVELAHAAAAGLDPAQRRDQAIFHGVVLRVAAAAGAWTDVVDTAENLAGILPGAGSARAVAMVRTVATTLPADAPSGVVDAVRAALDAPET